MQIGHLFQSPALRKIWAEVESRDPPAAAAPVIVRWPRTPLPPATAAETAPTREIELV